MNEFEEKTEEQQGEEQQSENQESEEQITFYSGDPEKNAEITVSQIPKKKKDHRFLKGAVTGFAIGIVICLAAVFIIGYHIMQDEKLNDYTEVEEKLDVLSMIVEEGFLFDYDEEAMTEGIYKGYIEALDDPYSVYYDEEEFAELQEDNSSQYYGIGASMSQNVETGVITILKVFRESGAKDAGMQAGDILYMVDGEDITSQDVNTVVAKIRGEEGTTVEITVYRPSLEDYVTMTIERRAIKQDMVEWQMLQDDIGYIQIDQFTEVTYEQFAQAVDELKSQGMERMILDLRSNPGGLLDSCVSVADDLLDEGVVVSLKDKNGKGESYYSEEGTTFDGPIVVLVNGYSASASEVLTGALKDYERATIVGTQTYGKGIVQNVMSLGDGTGIKITIAKYYSPNGTNIHEIGITPDVVVEYEDSEDGTDNQLNKAIEIIQEK